MTNKENALVALKGEVPEFVPCFYSSCQIMIVDGFGDLPPLPAVYLEMINMVYIKPRLKALEAFLLRFRLCRRY